MKILNLYSGIGGNRKLWTDVEVTAVEIDKIVAEVYIWSSPPCPSHSKIRNIAGVGRGQNELIYPDMSLYQEIIILRRALKLRLLQNFTAENVETYYQPLLSPRKIGRHFIWSNFYIYQFNIKLKKQLIELSPKQLADEYGFYNIRDKKLLRNCVHPQVGLHIFNSIPRTKRPSLLL